MKQRTTSASMTNNNRKTFYLLHSIFTGLILCATLLTLSALNPMPGLAQTRERKEFRQLSQYEWLRFLSAVKKLNTRPISSKPSKYDAFVKLRIDKSTEVRYTALFLPFHRKYLLEFEKALQQIDPAVTLPYWDWSNDASAPHLSPIFTSDYMGGNGRAADLVVNTGLLAMWKIFYPYNHYLTRNFNGGNNTIRALISADRLQAISTNSKTYDNFRQGIEYFALGYVHNGIGGDMATEYAPNDPIYWLHMAFVDKLWDSWQRASLSHLNSFSGKLADGSTATTASLLPSYNVSVSSVMDTAKLGYSYSK